MTMCLYYKLLQNECVKFKRIKKVCKRLKYNVKLSVLCKNANCCLINTFFSKKIIKLVLILHLIFHE